MFFGQKIRTHIYNHIYSIFSDNDSNDSSNDNDNKDNDNDDANTYRYCVLPWAKLPMFVDPNLFGCEQPNNSGSSLVGVPH